MKLSSMYFFKMVPIIFLLMACDRNQAITYEQTAPDIQAIFQDSVNAQRLNEARADAAIIIRQTIENRNLDDRFRVQGQPLYSSVLFPKFYVDHAFQPIWISASNGTGLIRSMIDFIGEIDNQGLNPQHYHFHSLQEQWAAYEVDSSLLFEGDFLANMDMLLTDSYFMLASHLYHGKVDQENLKAQWDIRRNRPNLALDQNLHQMIANGSVAESFQQYYPPHPGYLAMIAEAGKLKKLAENEDTEKIDIPAKALPIKPGDSSAYIPQVKKRLRVLGLYPADTIPFSSTLDESTRAALQKLQSMFGFNTDGALGTNTLKALNTTYAERLQKLYVNMERLRWMPDSLEDRYILVNIADFTLSAMQNKDTLITMRTVVGKNFRQTPVFHSLMTYIVFSPVWTVPPGIMQNDVIPAVRKNAGYLTDKKMQIYNARGEMVDPATVDWNTDGMRYTIRQTPGAHNALGRVKFMFPNKYSVYLHDTPSRELFARDERVFSSGCIRIEKPMEMAIVLLSDTPGWDKNRIREAMTANTERTIILKNPVGVYLYYLTAWANDNGTLNYRKDVYNRDQEILEALAENKMGS